MGGGGYSGMIKHIDLFDAPLSNEEIKSRYL